MKRRWTTLHSLKDLHDAAEADEQARRKDEYDRKKDLRRNRPPKRTMTTAHEKSPR